MNAPPARVHTPRERRGWPRLMKRADACDYVSLGETRLRTHGPAPHMVDGVERWDRRDLDRWVDALDGQPLGPSEIAAESNDVERRFLERRKERDANR